jgi:hypothetical protein
MQRYDFSAKIALPCGEFKTVLIELQKAKLASDIMRFRRYPGRNYQDPDNAHDEGNERKARQIEMEMEDDYLKELQDKERFLAEKDKIIAEKDKALEEKDKIIEELKKQLPGI